MTKKVKGLFMALCCVGLPMLSFAQEGSSYTPPTAADFTPTITSTAGTIADAVKDWVTAIFPILGGVMVIGFAVFFFIWAIRKLRQGVGR